jgi:hypothetical protein
MRNPLVIILLGCLPGASPVMADENSALDYAFTISLETSEIDNLSLGDDPRVEKLKEEEYELELALEYTVNDNVYLFLVAGLVDETETVKPVGEEDEANGLERKQMGVGVYFGEEIASEFILGRREFVSASEWWIWWDEELDAISLDSAYGNFETLIGVAEEQWKESTDDDFVDPEIDDVLRIIASLSWEFADNHSLNFYYLDQHDNSNSHNVGDIEDFDESDEADGDLTWRGVSYLGEFDFDRVGEIEIELHYSRVSGDETFYEFGDPEGGKVEVEEKGSARVSAEAHSYLLSWTPAQLEDWSFIVGGARGEGDSNPDDGRDESYRQNDLQGDSDVFGELYQPEISNLVVQAFGIEWEAYEGVEIALMHYDYEQDERSDEIADVTIEADPTGLSSDLGKEIDLIVTIEAYDSLELVFIAAQFEAGKAYGNNDGETSNFISFEIEYEF